MACKMAVTSSLRNRFQSFWAQIKADVPLSKVLISDMVLLYANDTKINQYYRGNHDFHQKCCQNVGPQPMFCKMAVSSSLRNRFQSFGAQIKADVPLSLVLISNMVLLYAIDTKIDQYYR